MEFGEAGLPGDFTRPLRQIRLSAIMAVMIVFPEMAPGDLLPVSATLYNLYRQCPDRALAYSEGHYGPPSPASFAGSLAHRLFARRLTEGPIPEGDFERTARREVGNDFRLNRDLGELTNTGKMKMRDLDKVFAEVERMCQRFEFYPVEGFREAEISLDHHLPGEVKLRGRVDACFDDREGVRLVDWKTGGLGEARAQLRFYALVWTLERGEAPHRVEAVSLRTGEREGETPTAGALQETAEEVAELVNRLRTAGEDRLPRRPGPLCEYCPILDSCPEGRGAMETLNAAR